MNGAGKPTLGAAANPVDSSKGVTGAATPLESSGRVTGTPLKSSGGAAGIAMPPGGQSRVINGMPLGRKAQSRCPKSHPTLDGMARSKARTGDRKPL